MSVVAGMLSNLLLVSAPLSLPSLYLAYRLRRAGYLATVFNQQAALLLTASGQLTSSEENEECNIF